MKISFHENFKHINGLETSNESKTVLYGNFVKYLHLVLCNGTTNLLSNENAQFCDLMANGVCIAIP